LEIAEVAEDDVTSAISQSAELQAGNQTAARIVQSSNVRLTEPVAINHFQNAHHGLRVESFVIGRLHVRMSGHPQHFHNELYDL
jgi:hypothetical protein